jgi:hypothetical protein
MECERQGCTNGCCKRKSDIFGYICQSCSNSLARQLDNDPEFNVYLFMNTFPAPKIDKVSGFILMNDVFPITINDSSSTVFIPE